MRELRQQRSAIGKTHALLSAYLTPVRVEQAELLDLGWGSPTDVVANLAEMDKINRYLGGEHALTRHLYPRLQAITHPVTVLDLGTGSGGIPAHIARWAAVRGLRVRVLGLDRALRNLRAVPAHTRGVSGVDLVCADAFQVPIASGEADYIISSMFLHHFRPEKLVRLLQRCWEIAGRGIIMSDLVRGWLPYMAFKLVQPLFARNFLTRHDGALSIRRAYTPAELQELAAAAGLSGVQLHAHFPWRMTLVVDKQGCRKESERESTPR